MSASPTAGSFVINEIIQCTGRLLIDTPRQQVDLPIRLAVPPRERLTARLVRACHGKFVSAILW
jgi:hypothetical protein